VPYFSMCGGLCILWWFFDRTGEVCVLVVNCRYLSIGFTIMDYVIGTRLTAIACLPYTTHSGTLARSYRTDRVRFPVISVGGGVEIQARSNCLGGFLASFGTMTVDQVRRSMLTMWTVIIHGGMVRIDGELKFLVRIP
jgi:hypothetical protein